MNISVKFRDIIIIIVLSLLITPIVLIYNTKLGESLTSMIEIVQYYPESVKIILQTVGKTSSPPYPVIISFFGSMGGVGVIYVIFMVVAMSVKCLLTSLLSIIKKK